MIIIGLILVSIYALTLLILLIGFYKLPVFSSEKDTDTNHFSVIIPFRNEAHYLPELLKSILKIKYPKEQFEILFVNDASEDNSVAVLSEGLKNTAINWRLLSNIRHSKSPKKDAITTAINVAKYDWIVTTDADCSIPELWLIGFNKFIQEKEPIMICGPVQITGSNSVVASFQKYEGLSLQGVTMGGFGMGQPLLCNGANLAYRKEAFTKVGGFSGNDTIASGDDIFLLEKMRRQYPKRVFYLKNPSSIVCTPAENGWKDAINQRIRWAAKTSQQNNAATKLVGVVVFLVNLWFVVGLFWALFEVEEFHYSYALFFILKVFTDALFVHRINSLFRNKINNFLLILNSALYPFITLVIVIRSLFGHYKWKGRHFKK